MTVEHVRERTVKMDTEDARKLIGWLRTAVVVESLQPAAEALDEAVELVTSHDGVSSAVVSIEVTE